MSTTTTTRDLGPCPACDKPIVATVALAIGDLALDGKDATVSVKAVGLRVSHDCTPKVTR